MKFIPVRGRKLKVESLAPLGVLLKFIPVRGRKQTRRTIYISSVELKFIPVRRRKLRQRGQNLVAGVEIYPREGTETGKALDQLVILGVLKFIPVRGRKRVLDEVKNAVIG